MFKRNLLIVLTSAWLSLSSLVQVGCGADPKETSRLRLKNGDWVDGNFSSSQEDGRIAWKSPLFLEPLDFDLNAIRSLDVKAKDEPVAATGDFLFESRSGDRFWGKVIEWTNDSIFIEMSNGVRVKMKPQSLRHIMKWGQQPSIIYSGPKSLEEWKPLDASSKWIMESGSLVAKEAGARIRGNLKLPEKFQADIRISFGKRPGFLVSFGVAEDQTAAGTAFTLEFFDQKFALVRELGKKSDLHMLESIDIKKGFVEITLFIDQMSGNAIAYSDQGKKLAEISLPAEKSQAFPCVLVENFNGEMRIDHIRIQPWTNQLPIDRQGYSNYVVGTDGALKSGRIQSFDPNQGWTLIGENNETTLLPVADLAEMVQNSVAGTSNSTPSTNETGAKTDEKNPARKDDVVSIADLEKTSPQGPKEDVVSVAELEKASTAMTLNLFDQTRFIGQVVRADANTIRFLPNAAIESIELPVSELSALRGSLPDLTLPKAEGVREGQLVLEGLQLHGILMESGMVDGATCLYWKPKISLNAVHMLTNAKGSIDFRRPEVRLNPASNVQQAVPANRVGAPRGATLTPSAPVKKASVPNLTLRTGDLILAEIVKIDEKGVTFKSSSTSTVFVPNEEVQGIELRRMRRDRIQSANKMARLLTVPRMKKNDPPTHLVASVDGDFLRGRLIGITDGVLSMEVRLEVVKLPVDNIAQIVWLHDKKWDDAKGKKDPTKEAPQAPVDDEFQIHAVERSGWKVTFAPTKIDAETMNGTSKLLGECNVVIKNIDMLLVGKSLGESARELAANPWSLSLAKAPKIYEEGGDAGDSSMGTASSLVGKPAPKLEGEMLSGDNFRLSEMKGSVVVLDFWASWCGPCMKSMPAIDAAVEEFGRDKVKLFAVNLEEPADRALAAMTRLKLETPVVLDIDGAAAQRYQANAIPQTVIIDSEGIVRFVFVGEGNRVMDAFRKGLQEVLDGKKAAN